MKNRESYNKLYNKHKIKIEFLIDKILTCKKQESEIENNHKRV